MPDTPRPATGADPEPTGLVDPRTIHPGPEVTQPGPGSAEAEPAGTRPARPSSRDSAEDEADDGAEPGLVDPRDRRRGPDLVP